MKIPATPPRIPLLQDKEYNDINQQHIQTLMRLLPSEIGKDRGPEYLHWDKLRRKALPENIDNHETWWHLKKFRRLSAFRNLPLSAKSQKPFVYWLPDPVLQNLHLIDQEASGRVELPEDVTGEKSRDRYLVSSLIEESINSSQLEGASTTYQVAKKMLRDNREPRDNSERMIFNNYKAMSFIREVSEEKLSKELLFEIHRIVTDGTLDNPDAAGRFRNTEEIIGVYDNRDQTLLHSPPNANELAARTDNLCKFANSKDNKNEFLHPVVRAIILHFMIGYDHPFVDGNGRTARALFYWSMAKHGYWLMEYISISSILKAAPAKYARAYLYTETDDNDTTYFIDHNTRTILQAIERLKEYLQKKSYEVKRVEVALGNTMLSRQLNHRQLAVLSHAIRNPGATYTVESHRSSHNIAYPTARADLLNLVSLKLLNQTKIGRAFVFEAIDNMEDIIKQSKNS